MDGRWRPVVHKRSLTRSRRGCVSSAVRSAPARTSGRSPTSRRTVSPCSTPTRRSCRRSPAMRCPPGTGDGSNASTTARRRSRSTTRSTARSRGTTRTAAAPAPSTWSAPWPRWWPRKPRSRPGACPTGRSCWWSNRPSSIPRRAPAGKHTLWAYAHVPHGYDGDATEAIEQQIERFAPGSETSCSPGTSRPRAELEAYNPNYVGGDIAGGAHSGLQLVFRPTIATAAVRDTEPVAVPVLGIDTARGRRPRDVRVARCRSCAPALIRWLLLMERQGRTRAPRPAGREHGDQVGQDEQCDDRTRESSNGCRRFGRRCRSRRCRTPTVRRPHRSGLRRRGSRP